MNTRRDRAHRIATGIGLVVATDLATKLIGAIASAGSSSGGVVPVRNHEFSLGIASAPPVTTLLIALCGIAIASAVLVGPALRGDMRPWIPALVLGAALANFVDRLAFGSVHDFLATPWVVFNLADVAVVAGLAGWLTSRRRTIKREVNECPPSAAPH